MTDTPSPSTTKLTYFDGFADGKRAAAATLPGKLAAEISRVTKIREQTMHAGEMCGGQVNMALLLFMLDQSIRSAIAAAGSPDIEGQIRAVRDLEGYES